MKINLLSLIATLLISFSGISQTKIYVPSWQTTNGLVPLGKGEKNQAGVPVGEWEYKANPEFTVKEIFNYDTYMARYYFQENTRTTVIGGLQAIGKLDRNFKKDGVWIWYHELTSGQIMQAKGNYEHGLQEGEWLYFHTNNELEKKVTFTHGDANGLVVFHDEMGNVNGESTYANGKQLGTAWRLEPGINGSFKKITETYVNDSKTGPYKEELLIDGKQYLFKTATYKDHFIAGDEIMYHDDGSVYTKTAYNGAHKPTSRKYFHQTGELHIRENLKNGYIKEGPYTIYHKNGEIYSAREYKNDLLLNVIETNNSKGERLDSGSFSNGNGTLNEYDFNGTLESTSDYANSIKKNTFRYEQGDLVHKDFFDDKGNTIKWIAYKGGEISEEFTIADDHKSTTQISYINGKKSKEKIDSHKEIIHMDYENGVIKEKRYHWKSKDVVSKKEIYENGKLIEEIVYEEK